MLNLAAFPIASLLTACQHSKWHQEEPDYVFRASHSGSAGSTSREEITCGAWSGVNVNDSFLHQWIFGNPKSHVPSHFEIHNTRPTMFISTTSELLRAVELACEFFRDGFLDVRISIIDVRAAKQRSYHDMTNATAIASSLDLPEPHLNLKEWLFLGRIKSPAIVHQVCVDQAIYDRMTWIFPALSGQRNLEILRENIRRDFNTRVPLIFDGKVPDDDGRRCGMFVECFRFSSDGIGLYKMMLGEVWMWKRMISLPDQKSQEQFLKIASIYAP
jgi:hypothetical protein